MSNIPSEPAPCTSVVTKLEQLIQNKEEGARSGEKLSGEGRVPQVKWKMRLMTG